MNRRKRNITFLTAVIILLIAAVSYERSFYDELSNTKISRQAQRYITSKSRAIDKYLEVLSDAVVAGEDLWSLPISNNYTVFVSAGANPVYWNSNRISPEHIPFSQQLTCHRIDNAWFLYKSSVAANRRIDVLVNIKNNYNINNDNFDNEDIGQSELSQYSISEVPLLGYNVVYNNHQRPLFYFAKTELNAHNKQHSLWVSALYIFLFLVILLFLSQWHSQQHINILSVLVFSLFFILGIRYFNFIPILNRSPLFDGEIYSNTGLMDSLGMLALGAIFWIIIAYKLSLSLRQLSPKPIYIIGGLALAIVAFYIIIQKYIHVIQHTDVHLQIFRIKLISKESFWIYGILLLYIGGWGQLVASFIRSCRLQKRIYLYPIAALILVSPLLWRCPIGVSAAGLYFILNIFTLRRKQQSQYVLIHLLAASMLLAGVVTYVTETESLKKNQFQKRLIINSLPPTLLQERDFDVEERLLDIWNEMQDDKSLQSLPVSLFNTPDYYANYIKNKYFQESMSDYDLQVVICNPVNYLQIEGSNASPNCYAYFQEMINQMGEPVKNTGFYWQKNNNGRVSYFGWLKVAEGSAKETSIFIDLESQILSEGQGYPEMMRDKGDKHYLPSRFSFARYVDGRLITSSGDYRYPASDQWLPTIDNSSKSFYFNNKNHLIYRISSNSRIVLTEERRSLLAPLYAYIYTFLMIYLSFILAYIITHQHSVNLRRTISNDIRFTIYSVLFLSLLLVGSASVFFPLNIYRQNQENMINEKSESFLLSISRELSNIQDIRSISQSSLQSLLTALSNTLYKDVHIYDLSGRIYASSRPEIFSMNLQGSMMHPKAFKALGEDNMMSMMQEENIGNNTYTASYFIISNAAEEPIAFINVPFFNSKQELRKSIYDYLVLLLNIYLLLIILVVIFTYFSVTTITKPLWVIQEGLSKMKLGSNEKIVYTREDEIGTLVEKYNIMVDELNASVQQLARSEREGAWQRMARQIAHEIKNPLTPMKLSIQHLMRTKTASPERFDEFFSKTANTLVEQIDNLSNIATSFSTFAKISDGTPERFDLNERLDNVVTLFKQSGNEVSFAPSEKTIPIKIDKDHFIQIFNNLIKNALQSVPEERDAKIEVSLEELHGKVNILVKDNGSGIDKEMSDKIFQPNFTTKNSGMGLGLAISQKMANNASGEISFRSNADIGTTFIVKLPVITDSDED